MDYKERIGHYRNMAKRWEQGEQLLLNGELRMQDTLREAARTIETLLAERDAAIADIFQSSDSLCNVCKYFPDDFSPICFNCTQIGGLNNNWQWRGPQKHD